MSGGNTVTAEDAAKRVGEPVVGGMSRKDAQADHQGAGPSQKCGTRCRFTNLTARGRKGAKPSCRFLRVRSSNFTKGYAKSKILFSIAKQP